MEPAVLARFVTRWQGVLPGARRAGSMRCSTPSRGCRAAAAARRSSSGRSCPPASRATCPAIWTRWPRRARWSGSEWSRWASATAGWRLPDRPAARLYAPRDRSGRRLSPWIAKERAVWSSCGAMARRSSTLHEGTGGGFPQSTVDALWSLVWPGLVHQRRPPGAARVRPRGGRSKGRRAVDGGATRRGGGRCHRAGFPRADRAARLPRGAGRWWRRASRDAARLTPSGARRWPSSCSPATASSPGRWARPRDPGRVRRRVRGPAGDGGPARSAAATSWAAWRPCSSLCPRRWTCCARCATGPSRRGRVLAGRRSGQPLRRAFALAAHRRDRRWTAPESDGGRAPGGARPRAHRQPCGAGGWRLAA